MRKKGENSVKRAGKAAIPPDKTMISRFGVESQTARYRGHVAMTRSTSLGAGGCRHSVFRSKPRAITPG
jgi:hypothetical protein